MNNYQKHLELTGLLASEPMPDIGMDWKMPGQGPLREKVIYLRVLSYYDGFADVLTVHSGRINKKTEHYVRKTFYKSRQEFGDNAIRK